MYLLFDIGGTNMRVAVSEDRQTLGQTKIVPTPEDFETGINRLKEVSYELTGGVKIDAIAGGIAVIFNQDKSIPINTSNLHGWVNKPLKQTLEQLFNCPVFLENDTALVGLGEAVSGESLGSNIVAYLGVGTGIGGARIVEGKIDKNSLGFEPGHQIIETDGKTCNCGGKGHLEAYVGGSYLEKDYGKPAKDISDPQVWDKVARYLSVGLCNTIVHWSPDVIILGGSVMQSLSIEKIKSYLEKDLTIFPNMPEIIPAKLGQEGGLYGALALLL